MDVYQTELSRIVTSLIYSHTDKEKKEQAVEFLV